MRKWSWWLQAAWCDLQLVVVGTVVTTWFRAAHSSSSPHVLHHVSRHVSVISCAMSVLWNRRVRLCSQQHPPLDQTETSHVCCLYCRTVRIDFRSGKLSVLGAFVPPGHSLTDGLGTGHGAPCTILSSRDSAVHSHSVILFSSNNF